MNLPQGFRENQQTGTVACPHRDLSCCDTCADSHDELVDVVGAHFWIADAADRLAFA